MLIKRHLAWVQNWCEASSIKSKKRERDDREKEETDTTNSANVNGGWYYRGGR